MIIEPPAKLYPARAKLGEKLARVKEFDGQLQEYHGTAAKAETTEQEALEDAKLTEEEAADRISRAQNLKGVFAARVKNRESALAKALLELKEAMSTAENELRGLVDTELGRRDAILTEKVRSTLQIPKEDGLAPFRLLIGHSPLIQSIRLLEPTSPFAGQDTPQQILDRAEGVLAKFHRVEIEARKEI